MADIDLTLVDRYLQQLWDRAGADLLFTTDAPPYIRVDGELEQLPEAALSSDDAGRIVGSLLGNQFTRAFEEELEVDFSFEWKDLARFRANAFHQRGSAALALRLIPFEIPSFDELLLPQSVRDLVHLPQGLILITGPTGSGKSTTIASLL